VETKGSYATFQQHKNIGPYDNGLQHPVVPDGSSDSRQHL
jgi:hypothetical protein